MAPDRLAAMFAGNVTPSGAEEIGEVGEGRLHGIDDGTACKDLGSLFQ